VSPLLWALFWAGHYEDGVAALKAGNGDVAAGHLEQAVELEPERVDAWWELGWARWLQGDYAQAAVCWTRVKALQPDHPEVDAWLEAAQTRARLQAGGGDAGAVPLVASEGRLRVAAAGDTMMGTDLRQGPKGLAPDDGAALFEGVAPWLIAADVAFLNVEGVLADDLPQTKCGANSQHCYAFRTPTRYTSALVGAGIDVVSLANNHSMDLGVPGMNASIAALDAVGIAHAGRYGDVALLDVDGLKVGVVAAHSGSCCLNVNRVDEVTAAIRELDAKADVVILSFHGGAEGASHRHVPGKVEIAWGERRGDVLALAHAAVDAGADLVLGHGPHVLRGMEVYQERLIVYSMGNFCGFKQFGTQGGYGGTSMVLDVELAHNGVLVGGVVHPVALDSQGRPRPDPDGAAWQQIAQLSAADFPETGVSFDADGAIRWATAP
jgi:hypothetical protein